MNNTPTITKYLFKLFTQYFIITSLVIVGVLFIANAFDILQKFKSANIRPYDFWQLISFKIPYLYNEISSLIGFISALLFLRKITIHNEMIIIIGNGMPIWKIFIIPVVATFLFGIIILAIINPLGTYGLKAYESLETKITGTPHHNVIISESGIFFFESFNDTNRIIQAKSIDSLKNTLKSVTILIVDEHNQLIESIDASSAILDNGEFRIKSPHITTKGSSEKLEQLDLPTNLSIKNLVQRFTPPEMLPIWRLKESIDSFLKSGLPTITYQVYYYKQIFKPLKMAAMVLLACWFISLNIRDNSGPKMMIFGLLLGFATYFLLEIILRILVFSSFNPMFATLLPILFIILASNFVILHFQEA